MNGAYCIAQCGKVNRSLSRLLYVCTLKGQASSSILTETHTYQPHRSLVQLRPIPYPITQIHRSTRPFNVFRHPPDL